MTRVLLELDEKLVVYSGARRYWQWRAASVKRKPHIAVVGAGAFGGWTALYLLRRGVRVTLLDAWGPGNSRSSSGGETRVIRGTYGPDQPYTELTARALRLWQEHQRRWKRQFLFPIGVLWMAASDDDDWERGSVDLLREWNIPHQRLSRIQLRKRWPQINFDDATWGVFEPESGYLTARNACQAVVDSFVKEGGEFRLAGVIGSELEVSSWKSLPLTDGSKLGADRYVFACGPWMSRLFPRTIGGRIRATKQDVFFFGTPHGDFRFEEGSIPVWADHGGRFMYGIPGNQGRGFKIADDTRGPEFDPTRGERVVSEEELLVVREYLAFRFPAMKDAPLLEARVCQYENTPDNHFLIDRHPDTESVWLVGGGSGHGFKHGPALGEMVADLVLNDKAAPSVWRLDRFAK